MQPLCGKRRLQFSYPSWLPSGGPFFASFRFRSDYAFANRIRVVSYTLHMGYVDWDGKLKYGIRGCNAVHLLLTCVFLTQWRTRYVIIPRLVRLNNYKNIFHRKIFFSAFVSAYPEGVSSPCATVQPKTLSPITFCEELRPVPVVSPLG